MDEVFVTQTNFASLRREVARAPRVTEGVAAQKAKMFYGKRIETALHALSLNIQLSNSVLGLTEQFL